MSIPDIYLGIPTNIANQTQTSGHLRTPLAVYADGGSNLPEISVPNPQMSGQTLPK